MVDVGVLPAFVAVILLVLIPPGPDMAFMVAVGLDGGRRSARKAILGIGTGMSVYAVAAAVGVGRVAQAYPLLLDAVKALGAVYLLWLAYVTIRKARRSATNPGVGSTGRPYARGAAVSLSNPKVILFFVAVLPQFVGTADNVGYQLAILGALTVLLEVVLYGSIGMLAGAFHSRSKDSPRTGAALHYIASGVYVVLAVAVMAQTLAGLTSAGSTGLVGRA